MSRLVPDSMRTTYDVSLQFEPYEFDTVADQALELFGVLGAVCYGKVPHMYVHAGKVFAYVYGLAFPEGVRFDDYDKALRERANELGLTMPMTRSATMTMMANLETETL